MAPGLEGSRKRGIEAMNLKEGGRVSLRSCRPVLTDFCEQGSREVVAAGSKTGHLKVREMTRVRVCLYVDEMTQKRGKSIKHRIGKGGITSNG